MWMTILFLLVLATAIRVMLKPHREPISRLAWLVVVLSLPLLGVVAYLLLGETNIGRKRVEKVRVALAEIPSLANCPGWNEAVSKTEINPTYEPLFKTATALSGYAAIAGNNAELMADSDSAIDRMVEDIDAAASHVHLLFYIWMPDNNGTKMAHALIRAAARGVTCRAMVDDMGSRLLIKSQLWRTLKDGKVDVRRVLKVGNPLVRIFKGRIDLRNHRKILVIDNKVTYCGSQNCADPEFITKKKYAPWVDIVFRFTGPVVHENQHLFAIDWMSETQENLSEILLAPIAQAGGGFPAQVVASGPTMRYAAMPEIFESLIYSARSTLFITTPYYVPIASLQAAICAAANRGVCTTIIFPARNDDFAAGAASQSYYEELLTAGVKVYEYQPGLLHAKTLTLDGEITLVGSANMDRRSFDLNYENNILLNDKNVTADLLHRQHQFLKDSRKIELDEVNAWRLRKRLWNNTLAILGPVL